MIEFIRTSVIYLVKDKEEHLLDSLRKEYYTFSAEYGGETFFAIVTTSTDLKFLQASIYFHDDSFRITTSANLEFLKLSFEYVSDECITNTKVISEIDEVCKLIGDIQKTGSIYFKPVLR